jgi:uncharacterized repeat protein (TIGR03803 family)
MPSKRSLIVSVAAFIVISGLVTGADPALAAEADTEKVLWRFNFKDGFNPNGSLVFDAAGNLYDTAYEGSAGGGNVHELTLGVDGEWTENVLHRFCPKHDKCPDGVLPEGGVIFDAMGNLYGTTTFGGAFNNGVVFQLMPGADGKWTEKVLHNFNGKNGSVPVGSLIFDAAGNLYGTTLYGGSHINCSGTGCGVVFQLTPGQDGKWTETVLHSFGNGKDGSWPFSSLSIDALGNLYGTTKLGGGHGLGTVFELSPHTNGKWTERVLHSFNNYDGAYPQSNLVFDGSGNLYGTTTAGGDVACSPSNWCGTVFELLPDVNGKWTEKVLHSFYQPRFLLVGGVIFDPAGNLYGTTLGGGHYEGCTVSGCGTVYELSPTAGGKWTEITLHSFGKTGDGGEPTGNLVFDSLGNLYGETIWGGRCRDFDGCGTVFEITH